MLRNTPALKTDEYTFLLGFDYTQFFKIFDTFPKRQTNLKFSKFCLYRCINMASILQHQ